MREPTGVDRALHQITVAELVELIGIQRLQTGQRDLGVSIRRLTAQVLSHQEKIMTALEDLQAADADLAATVTDLTGAVDRIDADFAALEDAVKNGADPAAVEAEVAKIRASIDAAKAAKDNIDTADPAAPAPPAGGGVV